MQYQVPQFTDVEDKIFGPLTLRQFVYIAGSAGLGFLLWRTLPSFIAAPLGLGIVGFGVALAFIQINKKPLIYIIEAAFMYVIKGKLYLWRVRREDTKGGKKTQGASLAQQQQQPVMPELSANKLKSLAWSLDINEHVGVERERDEREAPVPRV